MNNRLLSLPTLSSVLPHSRRPRIGLGWIALGLIVLMILGISIPAAHAQSYTEQTVHTFYSTGGTGTNGDGLEPFCTPINIDGVIYGTTMSGGTYNKGTVFSVNPKTQVETVLYSFNANSTDGYQPMAGLTNVGGVIYGTTAAGGAAKCGTIFSINPDGTGFQTLYSFLGKPSDGSGSQATLLNVNGILYGTTVGGGSVDDGTVFSFNPQTRTETNLHSFTENLTDGGWPYDSLTAINGTLYGTTEQGGSMYAGIIFAVNMDGSGYQVLHNFTYSSTDGGFPMGGLLNVNGTLYGTTAGQTTDAEGTIFSINPNGTGFQTLYRFTGGMDGGEPFDSLMNVNGVFYGTTFYGGINYEGTAFSYNPATNMETTLHDFDASANESGSSRGGLLSIGDAFYGTNFATVFSLTPTSETPVANDDTFTTTFNTPYTAAAPGILANDFAGGSPLKITLVQAPFYGKLVLHDDGSFVYTPSSSFVGTDFFRYQITNSLYPSGIATVTLNVKAVQPVANDDSYTLKDANTFTVNRPGILANDINGSNEGLITDLMTTTAHGSLSLDALGGFTYTPNPGFAGKDSFTYQAYNSGGTSNTATVTLIVPVSVPIAHNDNGRGRFNTPLVISAPGVLTNDTNSDTNPMTAALVSQPSHGTITFNSDGSFVYTPNTGFVGTDSFTYQAANSVGTSNIATCTLTIQATAPTAGNDSGRTYYNTSMIIGAPGVLGNDKNGDNSTLTAQLVSNPAHGTITFHSDGSFTYTPTSGFVGTDSFTYQAVNDIGVSNIATCTLNVQARAPVANNDNGRCQHNTTLVITAPGVLTNDNPGTNTGVTAALVTNPTHGTITFNSDGSFQYTPTIGFIGTDSFTYNDTNSVGTSNTATCTLTVQ